MSENNLWEYRVQCFGATLKNIKDEELETTLNQWGEEGWEVVSAHPVEGSYKLRLIAKRPLTTAVRRQRSMPG